MKTPYKIAAVAVLLVAICIGLSFIGYHMSGQAKAAEEHQKEQEALQEALQEAFDEVFRVEE